MIHKLKRYLITTSDERLWKFDRPVIFLGEWCRIYEKRHIWNKMDAIVAQPYGLGHVKKDMDYIEARTIERKIFPALCEVLNRYHEVQHEERFWGIVLGHWLHRYANVMLNRIKTLEQCFKEYQISGMTAYTDDHFMLAPPNSYTAIWAFNDNRWNNALNVRIIHLLRIDNIDIDFINGCGSIDYKFLISPGCFSVKNKIFTDTSHQMARLLRYFMRPTDAFIINSYLPKKEAIKLYFALGQCPQVWLSPILSVSEKVDHVLRKKLSNQIACASENKYEAIAVKMVFDLLPISYLEDFSINYEAVNKLPWPKKPKFIFTSNNFDTDEVFKLWTATKVESGSRYFIGQHGNNYGVTRNHLNPSNEEITADKFLTWGWADGLPQHTPAFIFKTSGRNKQYFNRQGGLLLIELHLNHRITTYDGTFEHIEYFKEQQKFILQLSSKIRENVTIRLHGGYRYTTWSDETRWKDFDQAIKIDTGGVPISDLVARSRLVVHSYDSTGILETLSQNIPTLAFWQNGLEHVRDSAKPYYQLLVDAEIVHLTPESVARKVNEIWDDINGWWLQSYVQEVRKKFCNRYAKESKKPISELKKIFFN